MRSLIIYSIFISAFFSVQIKKRLEINQELCNDSKNAFFPMHLKFITLVNDQENIQVNASTLIPCDRIDDFKIDVVLNGTPTTMTFNQEEKFFNEALSRTAPMTIEQTAEWWNSFINGFKSVVFEAKISVTDNQATIELVHMNPQVLMHLESLKIPFEEGVFNYDIDAVLKERQPKAQTIVQHQQMTPELMEMFKQQLMKQDKMEQLMNQLNNGTSKIQTSKDGQNQIQIVVQRKIVDMMDNQSKENKGKFLI